MDVDVPYFQTKPISIGSNMNPDDLESKPSYWIWSNPGWGATAGGDGVKNPLLLWIKKNLVSGEDFPSTFS